MFRDLSPTEQRLVLACFALADAIFAANYYLELGLFASAAKLTMILGFVATVLLALYFGPIPRNRQSDRDGREPNGN